jgi:hypothetical protein
LSKYGNYITEIGLVGVLDRNEYVTYVDANNNNHQNWQHILRHNNHGFVLNNLKLKKLKDGRTVINADSDPIIEWETDDPNEIWQDLKSIWEEEDDRKGRNNWRDLFE